MFLVASSPHIMIGFAPLLLHLHSLRDLYTLQKCYVLPVGFSSTLVLCEPLLIANCLSISLSVAVQ